MTRRRVAPGPFDFLALLHEGVVTVQGVLKSAFTKTDALQFPQTPRDREIGYTLLFVK